MHRSVRIAAVMALASMTSGCVMAARHIAKEANRSSVQGKGRHRFPPGTSIAKARTTLVSDGYRCRDIPADKKAKPHVSCWPTAHRTDALEKFLIGGNWRWDLYGDGDTLKQVRIASARHGMKRHKDAATNASADETTPSPNPL